MLLIHTLSYYSSRIDANVTMKGTTPSQGKKLLVLKVIPNEQNKPLITMVQI